MNMAIIAGILLAYVAVQAHNEAQKVVIDHKTGKLVPKGTP